MALGFTKETIQPLLLSNNQLYNCINALYKENHNSKLHEVLVMLKN